MGNSLSVPRAPARGSVIPDPTKGASLGGTTGSRADPARGQSVSSAVLNERKSKSPKKAVERQKWQDLTIRGK